jgi:uncharacterized protein YaaQ
VRPVIVVVEQPLVRELLHLLDALEEIRVEDLLAVTLVEALDECILVRLPRLDEADFDAVLCAPALERLGEKLRPIVHTHGCRQAVHLSELLHHAHDTRRRNRCPHLDCQTFSSRFPGQSYQSLARQLPVQSFPRGGSIVLLPPWRFPDLGAPNTAATHQSDGTFDVLGYFDAQNGFGALIRTHFYCDLIALGDNKWQATTIMVGDDDKSVAEILSHVQEKQRAREARGESSRSRLSVSEHGPASERVARRS